MKKNSLLFMLIFCSIFYPSVGFTDPLPLDKYAKSVFSQNGEDGVLEKIFEMIKPTTQYAVEFGAGDGVSLSNTRNLIVNHGWSALLMEGEPALTKIMQKEYANNPKVRAIQAWIYPGNIEILMEENGVPQDLDLLSIDIDSNDYYVWKVIHDFHPKVVVIEYNASFPPPLKRVVDFHPMNYWDQTDYYGASIQSLYELGKKKGYELIYVTPGGINLIFVEKKYYELFGLSDNSPAKMYRPPQYGAESGGRAPNGKGWPMYEKKWWSKDLVISKFKIQKKMVER